MRILWEAAEAYDALGGNESVHEILRGAFSFVPREHLRQLDGVYVSDFDPKGERLGVYERDRAGNRIALYLYPHWLDIQSARPELLKLAFSLHLAHTLYHEVGHHVTLTLNKRRAPSKKREAVSGTLEKWAEEYTEKRMARYRESLGLTAAVSASGASR